MKKRSIWEYPIEEQEITSIEEKETDVFIIGGGITGIMLAYFLKDSNKKILLADKGRIGNGVTARTTAKISYIQGDIYQKLKKNFNYDVSYQYYKSQKDAIKLLTEVVDKEKIDCELKEVPFVLFTTEEKNRKKIEEEKKLLEQFGEHPVEFLNPKIKSGIEVSNTYVFHPLKFVNGVRKCLGNSIKIYENTLVTNIEKKDDFYLVSAGGKKIKAKYVAVTCHYPFFLVPGFIPFKTYIKREYVNAGKYKVEKEYSMVNVDKNLQSVRFYHDYILYDSNNHKLTSKIEYGKNYGQSQEDYKKHFSTAPSYSFMNQDIVSHDDLPLIGSIDKNLFLSTAYHAWGMTNGVLGASILADQIEGKKNPYEKLYNPKRGNLVLFINSFLGIFCYLKAYILSVFKKNNLSYITIHGITYAIYKDKKNNLHKVSLICPHMKCPLVFNQEEETWDCPCHGSRFTIDGKLIEGPSKEKIQKKV